MKEKSLMERILEAGYPEDEVYHHYSDLYVYKTPLTTKVINEWLEENGWGRAIRDPGSLFVDEFVDNITGRKMYDVAFQYTPYWESIGRTDTADNTN